MYVRKCFLGKMIDPEKGKRIFLFTMPYMNESKDVSLHIYTDYIRKCCNLGGLHKQFKTHKCIIEHMYHYPDEEEIIFKNFLILFLHVFQGLEYLHEKEIVHGDVKGMQIRLTP